MRFGCLACVTAVSTSDQIVNAFYSTFLEADFYEGSYDCADHLGKEGVGYKVDCPEGRSSKFNVQSCRCGR